MESKESISLIGTTLEGVSVVKLIENEDGLNLTEIADAIVAFIRSMGYSYVDGVTFECDTDMFGTVVHGSTL